MKCYLFIYQLNILSQTNVSARESQQENLRKSIQQVDFILKVSFSL